MYKTNSINFKSHLEDYCPDHCKTCKSGDFHPEKFRGGLPVNTNGFCQHFCSFENNHTITAPGYCGNGAKHYTGVDCRECKIGKWFEKSRNYIIYMV